MRYKESTMSTKSKYLDQISPRREFYHVGMSIKICSFLPQPQPQRLPRGTNPSATRRLNNHSRTSLATIRKSLSVAPQTLDTFVCLFQTAWVQRVMRRGGTSLGFGDPATVNHKIENSIGFVNVDLINSQPHRQIAIIECSLCKYSLPLFSSRGPLVSLPLEPMLPLW
jgi:hypothetical protein